MSFKKFFHSKNQIMVTLFLIIGIISLLALDLSKISKINLWSILKIGPVCKKCNIVLVSLDTLSSNHLPCYGYERNTAPNLCAFAEKNIYFTNSFSNSSFTLPSHFSIFTGLYPSHHGMMVPFRDVLNPRIITLPQLLKSNNYQTIYVGPANDSSLSIDKGIGRGFDQIISYEGNKTINVWDKGYEQLLRNIKDGKSTFLFLHTYYVHTPYVVDKKAKRLYTNGYYPQIPLTYQEYSRFTYSFLNHVLTSLESRMRRGGSPESYQLNKDRYNQLNNASNLAEAEKIYNGFPDFEKKSFWSTYYLSKIINKHDQRQIEYIKALYDELINDLDKKLLFLLNLVSDPRLSNNTIVIITSDHGEEFMEHGDIGHAKNLYNTSTTVPLIMHIPFIKNKRIDSIVQGIDIFSTILDLTGVTSRPVVDGISLTDLILGNTKASQNQYLISQHSLVDSIRNIQWKLYLKKGDQIGLVELYNLKNDPLEKNNLYSQQVDLIKNLSTEYKRILNRENIYPSLSQPFPEWIDEEKRQKLIKEGYF